MMSVFGEETGGEQNCLASDVANVSIHWKNDKKQLYHLQQIVSNSAKSDSFHISGSFGGKFFAQFW